MSLLRSSAVLSLLCIDAAAKEDGLKLFDVDAAVRVIQKSVLTVMNCLLHHVRLMCTGEPTVKEERFSIIVALSSLLYALDALAFWYYHSSVSLAILFSMVTVTSLVSDSLISSAAWRATDRLVSTTACKTAVKRRASNVHVSLNVVSTMLCLWLPPWPSDQA